MAFPPHQIYVVVTRGPGEPPRLDASPQLQRDSDLHMRLFHTTRPAESTDHDDDDENVNQHPWKSSHFTDRTCQSSIGHRKHVRSSAYYHRSCPDVPITRCFELVGRPSDIDAGCGWVCTKSYRPEPKYGEGAGPPSIRSPYRVEFRGWWLT